jgi:hypothetical protein
MAQAWHFSGWVCAYLSEPEKAIERVVRALRLSPFDSFTFMAYGALAFANFMAGRHSEAAMWAQRSVHEQPSFLPALRMQAANLALCGQMEPAHRTMRRIRALDARLRIADVRELTPIQDAVKLAQYEHGLRLAGLPE